MHNNKGKEMSKKFGLLAVGALLATVIAVPSFAGQEIELATIKDKSVPNLAIVEIGKYISGNMRLTSSTKCMKESLDGELTNYINPASSQATGSKFYMEPGCKYTIHCTHGGARGTAEAGGVYYYPGEGEENSVCGIAG